VYYYFLPTAKCGIGQVSVSVRKRLYECMVFVVLASGVTGGQLNLSFFNLWLSWSWRELL